MRICLFIQICIYILWTFLAKRCTILSAKEDTSRNDVLGFAKTATKQPLVTLVLNLIDNYLPIKA